MFGRSDRTDPDAAIDRLTKQTNRLRKRDRGSRELPVLLEKLALHCHGRYTLGRNPFDLDTAAALFAETLDRICLAA